MGMAQNSTEVKHVLMLAKGAAVRAARLDKIHFTFTEAEVNRL